MQMIRLIVWGILIIALLSIGCGSTSKEISPGSTTPAKPAAGSHRIETNALTKQELKEGWRLLFDGKTTAGWRKPYKEFFPEKGWEVKNGEFRVQGDKGGSIITIAEFGNFEFKLDFKLTRAATSGVKYNVVEKYDGATIGLEYQISDDAGYPYKLKDVQTCASLYDLIPAEKRTLKPAGEWNSIRIVVDGDLVEHWLNGAKVLDYRRCGQMFKALVKNSKFAKYENYGCWPRGHILLQDHGDEVAFRNIKIREFDSLH